MNIDAYFQRIGFTGTPEPTLAVLQAVHHLHPLAIPFENLSSLLATPVSLAPAAVYEKLVIRGRGGYCFEHNGLLAAVLREMGYDVSTHAARVVWHGVSKHLVPRTHMLLKVRIDGNDYIADTGFGGLTMTAPVLLATGRVQDSPHEKFRIDREGEDYVISAWLGQHWKAMYVFDLSSQQTADFELANYYVSSHPESRFVQNLIAARPYKNGRHALLDNHYVKYTRDGRKTEKTVSDTGELLMLLDEIFRIRLDASVDTALLRTKIDTMIARSQEA